MRKNLKHLYQFQTKLEQLEHLRSEDTPHRLMITHTIDQFILDAKSKQDKVKVFFFFFFFLITTKTTNPGFYICPYNATWKVWGHYYQHFTS